MNISFTSRTLKAAAVSLALTGAFALAAKPANAADMKLRLAWYMPPGTATAKQGEAIAKNIESMSKGKIAVQTYASGSLLKESNMADGLANNTANLGIMAMHWWSSKDPALEWDTIPFLVDDAGKLLDDLHGKLGQDVNKALNKYGVQIVGWGFYGYAKSYVNNQHPIKQPSDLKGLKMRSEGHLSAQFLKSEGAIPVAVDSSEVYTSLQRGTLNGAVSGLSSIISRKWYEVGNYITAIHYVPLIYPVQVNLHWWQGLTQDQRDLILKAVAATEKDAVSNIEAEFNNDIKIAEKNGNKVYRPTEADLKAWKGKAGKLERESYLKNAGAEGKQFLDDIDAANNGKS